MRFDIYGRFLLDIECTPDCYRVYVLGPEGKRRPSDIALPPDLSEAEIEQFLDDPLHEAGGVGKRIRRAQVFSNGR
jgi:hypothetical protein